MVGDCNTEDVRWVLRERPLILQGADPHDFACEVPTIALQRKMRPEIENFLDDLLSWTTFEISWTQRYAVEAISRMLYTLERGEVISKQDALDWGTVAMPPEWGDLIDQVRQDRFVAWNERPRPGSVARTLEFIEYVQERARTEQDHSSGDIPERCRTRPSALHVRSLAGCVCKNSASVAVAWGPGRQPQSDMEAERAVAIVARLTQSGVSLWLDGGLGSRRASWIADTAPRRSRSDSSP